jgi:hypothetical protein
MHDMTVGTYFKLRFFAGFGGTEELTGLASVLFEFSPPTNMPEVFPL